jgi:hypothetical protein
MFSGGTYADVERWLRNFLTSHAKRVSPRVEAELDAGDEREGKSYGARLRLGARVSPALEFDFREVADKRGSLAWCADLAERTEALARALVTERGAANARAR